MFSPIRVLCNAFSLFRFSGHGTSVHPIIGVTPSAWLLWNVQNPGLLIRKTPEYKPSRDTRGAKSYGMITPISNLCCALVYSGQCQLSSPDDGRLFLRVPTATATDPPGYPARTVWLDDAAASAFKFALSQLPPPRLLWSRLIPPIILRRHLPLFTICPPATGSTGSKSSGTMKSLTCVDWRTRSSTMRKRRICTSTCKPALGGRPYRLPSPD